MEYDIIIQYHYRFGHLGIIQKIQYYLSSHQQSPSLISMPMGTNLITQLLNKNENNVGIEITCVMWKLTIANILRAISRIIKGKS